MEESSSGRIVLANMSPNAKLAADARAARVRAEAIADAVKEPFTDADSGRFPSPAND